ncbi:MAG: hypothetical protein JNL34_00695 [Anaerolineae bacterium]|nr:hypothetical protein [Anaerolineae bacterium]
MFDTLLDLIGPGADVLHFKPGRLTPILLLGVAVLIVIILLVLAGQ